MRQHVGGHLGLVSFDTWYRVTGGMCRAALGLGIRIGEVRVNTTRPMLWDMAKFNTWQQNMEKG
jgi:hypothetical protein